MADRTYVTEAETTALIQRLPLGTALPLCFGPGWVAINGGDPAASPALAMLERIRHEAAAGARGYH